LVLAGALLTGDVWLTRAGAVVAFLGGLISCLLAWREVKDQRAAYELRSTVELRQHGDRLHAEREQHRRLLDVLAARNRELRSQLTTANARVSQLSQEVAMLRGDKVSLKLELARLNELNNAEVLALPRRVAGPVSGSEEVLWSEENLPTVVDLAAITAPFGIEERLRRLS
jgi:hypothetical protein